MSNESAQSVDFAGIIDGHAPILPNLPPQSPELEYLVGRMKDLFQAADTANIGRTLNMNLFLASMNGDAFMAIDPDTGAMYRVLDQDEMEYASQNNRMIINHRALWGKLTHNSPQFIVTPGPDATMDQVQGARAAEGFLKHLQDSSEVFKYISLAKKDSTWSYNGGLVFMRWNPLAGSSYCLCSECGYKEDGDDLADMPCPVCEGYQQQQAQMAQIQAFQQQNPPEMPPPNPGGPQSPPNLSVVPQTGEAGISTGSGVIPKLLCYKRGAPTLEQIDPRNLFVQPGVKSWEHCLWFIIRDPLPVQTVRSMFPNKALEIWAESDVYPSHGAQFTLDSTGSTVNERLRDSCYLYRFVERGSQLYPNGRIIYMVNSRIIHIEESHWKDFGRLPLFRYGWLPIENTCYFRPPAADAWSGQREFNRLETQQARNAAIVAYSNLILPYGCQVAADEKTARTGQALYPTAVTADKIRYLEPPKLSADVYARSARVDQSIQAHYGITPQEGGQETSDPNGRFAAIQEAESDQSVFPIIQMHNDETASLMRCYLILVQMYGDPDEKFTVLNGASQELYSFQDLKFARGNSDVSLVPGNGLASNPALRRADAENLASMGFFGMPGTPDFKFELFANFAGIKVPGLVPDMSDKQIQNAIGALKLIEDGYQFQPMPWDDVDKFIMVFQDWLVINGRNYIQKGRQQVVDNVLQAQDFYKQMAIMADQQAAQAQAQEQAGNNPGAAPPNGGSNPNSKNPGSKPGQTMSAPGGTPNGPSKAVSDNAGQIIKGADKSAENAVRGQGKHEG